MASLTRLFKTQLTATTAVVYTPPAAGAVLKGLRIVNLDTTARWVRVGIGGTADADLLLPPWAVDANGLITDSELVILADATHTINAYAEVAAKVNLFGFGLLL